MKCFEKYNNHQKSKEFISEKIVELRQEMKKLHEIVNYPAKELEFIIECVK